MSASLRLAFLLIALPLLALALAPLASWLAAPGAPPAPQGQPSEAERSARLDARRDVILGRIPATEAICRDLAERRLSVREAAQRLRALHEGDRGFWDALSLHGRGNEEERLARHVIALAVKRLKPAAACALQQSLEAELDGVPARPPLATP
jgi:hypothetical protein